MPQLNVPSTLYDTALLKTRKWIVQVASTIHKSAGDFDSAQCREAVSNFNHYLITSVPTQIIDELYNSAEVLLVYNTVGGQCQNQSPCFKQTFDQRIVLSMYIHKNMKVLTAHKIVNDLFWKQTLSSLNNLVRLDLNKVCTDEILEVVGRHCKSLEFVNIVSKSCHTRTKDRHNALKLQLCVSDVGLKFLSNCKHLIEIQMTCIIRKGCGGRQITNDGIKHLILSLPKLRRINYTDTGILLDSITPESDKLSLVSVTDYHPRASRIPKIELLCPFLSELHLTYAFSHDDYRNDVISALSSSGLKISNLSLTNFPFDDYLKQYLELKGTYLKVFNFISSFLMSVNELFRLLGWTCPNLETMHMHLHLYDIGYISNQCPFVLSSTNNEKLFSNLRSLTIKGVYWDSNYILPLLLKNATCIKTIILTNHSYRGCLDDVLQTIQRTNPFHYLENVSFLKGINVSFEFLKAFLVSCPMLTNVVIENESQHFYESVIQLRDDLKSKNFNVNIDVYGLT